jgi:hypothetical protein
MSEQERECFVCFLHWIQVLNLALADKDNKDKEGYQMFVRAEVERFEGYLATIRDELDKLKQRLQ